MGKRPAFVILNGIENGSDFTVASPAETLSCGRKAISPTAVSISPRMVSAVTTFVPLVFGLGESDAVPTVRLPSRLSRLRSCDFLLDMK